MSTLSIDEAATYAMAAGFKLDGLVKILCIAIAESALNPAATNTNNNTPPSTDRGILQINSYWHSEVSDACAFDPACAFKEGYRISSQGTNFNSWSTYVNGAWSRFESQVRTVLDATPTTPQPQPPKLVLSPAGAVADLTSSNQLDGGSQDKCGPWTAAELKYANLPGKGGVAKTLIQSFAHAEYVKYIGPDVPSDQQGSSIDNMHSFFKDAGNLHYWDIEAISATSAQASDLAHLRRAVGAGYPVAMTVAEQSVISKRSGKCPYPWQPRLGNVNHIFTLVGLDKDGDFIVADELNSFEPWPAIYKAAVIDCSWASVVQLVGPDARTPWLAPIPSGDPTSWPVDFNAQLFAKEQPPVVTPPTEPVPSFMDLMWMLTTIGGVAVGNNAPALVGLFPQDQPPSYQTGIAMSWRNEFRAGHNYGPPISYERPATNAQGKAIVVQLFVGGWCEWDETGTGTFHAWA